MKSISNHTFDFENHEMHTLSQRVFVYDFLFAKGKLWWNGMSWSAQVDALEC